MAKLEVGINDLASVNPNLATEWHPTKNNGLSPQDVSAFSHKTVWWLGFCGHEWQAAISNRNHGRGCPICAGRVVLSGFNDLATKNPALAAEWHPTKNGDLTPNDITLGTDQKVWWLGICGHEWNATVLSRSYGKGCPICTGKIVLSGFNDLATKNPALAAEWHPTKNDGLTPQNVIQFANKKVWWLGSCGHEWQATIISRGQGRGCPICAGRQILVGFNDLATRNPTLAAEWHPTKNEGLTPQDVTLSSSKKVWWLGSCSHDWQAFVFHRSRGSGCPYCEKRGRPKKKVIEYK